MNKKFKKIEERLKFLDSLNAGYNILKLAHERQERENNDSLLSRVWLLSLLGGMLGFGVGVLLYNSNMLKKYTPIHFGIIGVSVGTALGLIANIINELFFKSKPGDIGMIMKEFFKEKGIPQEVNFKLKPSEKFIPLPAENLVRYEDYSYKNKNPNLPLWIESKEIPEINWKREDSQDVPLVSKSYPSVNRKPEVDEQPLTLSKVDYGEQPSIQPNIKEIQKERRINLPNIPQPEEEIKNEVVQLDRRREEKPESRLPSKLESTFSKRKPETSSPSIPTLPPQKQEYTISPKQFDLKRQELSYTPKVPFYEETTKIKNYNPDEEKNEKDWVPAVQLTNVKLHEVLPPLETKKEEQTISKKDKDEEEEKNIDINQYIIDGIKGMLLYGSLRLPYEVYKIIKSPGAKNKFVHNIVVDSFKQTILYTPELKNIFPRSVEYIRSNFSRVYLNDPHIIDLTERLKKYIIFEEGVKLSTKETANAIYETFNKGVLINTLNEGLEAFKNVNLSFEERFDRLNKVLNLIYSDRIIFPLYGKNKEGNSVVIGRVEIGPKKLFEFLTDYYSVSNTNIDNLYYFERFLIDPQLEKYADRPKELAAVMALFTDLYMKNGMGTPTDIEIKKLLSGEVDFSRAFRELFEIQKKTHHLNERVIYEKMSPYIELVFLLKNLKQDSSKSFYYLSSLDKKLMDFALWMTSLAFPGKSERFKADEILKAIEGMRSEIVTEKIPYKIYVDERTAREIGGVENKNLKEGPKRPGVRSDKKIVYENIKELLEEQNYSRDRKITKGRVLFESARFGLAALLYIKLQDWLAKSRLYREIPEPESNK